MAQEPSTHEIVEDGKAIECLVCGMVSHSLIDVANKYCGNCHAFHPIRAAAAPSPAPPAAEPQAKSSCPICGFASVTFVPPARDCLIVVSWDGRIENAGGLVSQVSALVGANPDAWGKPSLVLLPHGAKIDFIDEEKMRSLGWQRVPAGPPAG